MARLLKLQVTVKADAPAGASGRLQNLWVHCALAGQEKKALGKAQMDKTGQGTIDFQFPGEKPPVLDVIVSPIAAFGTFKRIKTEKVTVKEWQKTRDGWKATLSIGLSGVFFKSVDWLDEEFTVEGLLVNSYVCPETELTVETPIRHAKVKLYEVDRAQSLKPFCVPDIVLCKPITRPPCTPITCVPRFTCEPTELCSPVASCTPVIECGPLVGCTPAIATECGPSVAGELFDPGIIEDIRYRAKPTEAAISQGCCGSETPAAFQGIARMSSLPVMKPLSSPALPPKAAGTIGTALKTVRICKPVIGGLISYKRTQIGTECETDDAGRFWFTFTRNDFFQAPAGSSHTEDKDWDEFPDLLFEARLWIDGEFRLIYEEPYVDTRWNVGTYQYAKLVVNGSIPGCDPGDTGIDPAQTEAFLFHNVGNVEPGWISSDGVIRGAPVPADPWYDINEHVFGGGMEIYGQFNFAHVGKYYQVEYQQDGESDWHPMLGEQWYYSHYMGGGMYETKLKAPESFTGYPACYQIPDYTDNTITRKDEIIAWQSYRKDGSIPRYPNGLYHLRVQLLEKTGPTTVVPVAGFNPNTVILHLHIDNGWPIAEIDPTMYVGELAGSVLNVTGVPECGFVQRGNRYLLIHYTAQDPENHFRSYQVTVNRGAELPITIPAVSLPSPIVTSPALPGFALTPSYYTFAAPGDNFPNTYTAMSLAVDPWLPGSQPLKQCAYNFTLTVWDRVTNGYGRIHWSQHPITLTIME